MTIWFDHVLALFLAVLWPLWSHRGHASYRERLRAGSPCLRLAAYAEAIVTQWLVAAATIALWIHLSRNFDGLGLLGAEKGLLLPGLLVAAALGGLLFGQAFVVARREDTHAQVLESVRPYREVMPEDANDLTGFIGVSLTAGVCEELLYRGFLPWYLAHFMGPWGGHLVALAVFGACHSHLGAGAAVRAFVTGGVFAALYLWTGSLLPGMLLHAAVDASSGWMAYEVLREKPAPAVAG